eukprot:831259_1
MNVPTHHARKKEPRNVVNAGKYIIVQNNVKLRIGKHTKKVCRAADQLQGMTIFFDKYSSESRRQITTDLLNDTEMKFASNIINEFAFPNISLCPPSFIQQYGKYGNMNDIKTFTSDNTALVLISEIDLHYFRVPRHKEALSEITPIMYQKYVYGNEFDAFVCFVFNLMFSRFPDVMGDGTETGTQNINDYMREYYPQDGDYM